MNNFSLWSALNSQNRGQFSLAFRKQREKHCAVRSMLEKGCSLVLSDGVVLGNAGVTFSVHCSSHCSWIWFRLIWHANAVSIWWRAFQSIYLL